MKHKTQDYKISVVKYYLKENKSLNEVCDIFLVKTYPKYDSKKSTLRRKYKIYK